MICPDPSPAEFPHRQVGEQQDDLPSRGAHDAEWQAGHRSLESEAIREGERAGIDPARGHGLAERAGRQRLGDGPYIASALGVWAMVLLMLTILSASSLLGKRMGAIFKV